MGKREQNKYIKSNCEWRIKMVAALLAAAVSMWSQIHTRLKVRMVCSVNTLEFSGGARTVIQRFFLKRKQKENKSGALGFAIMAEWELWEAGKRQVKGKSREAGNVRKGAAGPWLCGWKGLNGAKTDSLKATFRALTKADSNPQKHPLFLLLRLLLYYYINISITADKHCCN